MNDWHYFQSCPVCSRTKLKIFKKGSLHLHQLEPATIKITDSHYGQTWNLSQCSDCGHIFANPCPPIELINRLYARIEDPEYEAEAANRAQNFIPILNQLDQIFPNRGKILDVGAATGIFLALAQKRKWQVTGVEPSTWAVRLASEKYNLNLIENTFEKVKLPAGNFQVITMIDFIEHVPHPKEAVRKAANLLQPEGILVIVTPNIKSLVARLAGKRWWHYRPAHLAFFTWSSLTTLLEQAGFQLLKKSTYIWTFSLYYLLSRFDSLRALWSPPKLALFWKKVQVKLPLGDSFVIFAAKKR